MSQRIKSGYGSLKSPLYLNANIIFSTSYCKLKKKPHSTLGKLKESGYQLVTSVITKYEVINNLMVDSRTKLSLQQARGLYRDVIEEFQILEITALHTINILTDDFMDRMIKSNITFRDGLHLEIAKLYKKTPVCTHDKHMKQSSSHEDKKKFYNKVYKPSELIKPNNERKK